MISRRVFRIDGYSEKGQVILYSKQITVITTNFLHLKMLYGKFDSRLGQG